MIVRESPVSGGRKRVLGIWDLHVSSLSLGGLLILVAELQMQRRIYGAKSSDLCVVGDTTHPLPIRGTQADQGLVALDTEAFQDSVLLSAILDMDGIDRCYVCGSIPTLQDFLQINSKAYVTWPELNQQGFVSHRYSNTMFAQKFYRENGFIPHLSCKAKNIQWAVRFIQQNVEPYVPVVVHLKNNPYETGCSNADFDAWMFFFKACCQKYDTKFILIGNEEIDQRIIDLPNTLVARDYGSNLSRDLALIQNAFAFMGMSSGPCNMAIFGVTPYIIYKNPAHDIEEMELELGQADSFPFARPFQKNLRVFETRENLMSEFSNLYTHANRQDWEMRVASLL